MVDRCATIKALGDDVIVKGMNALSSRNWAPNPHNKTPTLPAAVPWTRHVLGDEAIQQILVPLEWSDANMNKLALQFPEATVTRYDGLGAAARDSYRDYLRSLRPGVVGSSGQTTTPAP